MAGMNISTVLYRVYDQFKRKLRLLFPTHVSVNPSTMFCGEAVYWVITDIHNQNNCMGIMQAGSSSIKHEF